MMAAQVFKSALTSKTMKRKGILGFLLLSRERKLKWRGVEIFPLPLLLERPQKRGARPEIGFIH